MTKDLDILALDAATILAVKPRQAGAFLGQGTAGKRNFRKLAARWHPDFCADPQSAEVFSHLVTLRDRLQSLGSQRADTLLFTLADGHRKPVVVLETTPTDSGETLVLADGLAQRFDAATADLAQGMADTIASFGYADPAMQREMQRFLPKVGQRLTLIDGGSLYITPRDAGALPLFMVDTYLARSGRRIDAKGVAWIGSGLMNLAAWLAWSGLMHGSIDAASVAINPETHDVMLLGGWEYATPFGTRPRALPERTLWLAPKLGADGVPADGTIDPLLIRDLLRQLLGKPADGDLLAGRVVPMPIAEWLVFPPAADAFQDYALWRSALEQAWGRPRFHPMPFTAADVLGDRAA